MKIPNEFDWGFVYMFKCQLLRVHNMSMQFNILNFAKEPS